MGAGHDFADVRVHPVQRENAERSWTDDLWDLGRTAWNGVTNNTVSGTASLLEQAGDFPTGWAPAIFPTAMMQVLGPVRGAEVAMAAGDALAAPAQALPRALGPVEALGEISPVSALLAPLGMASNFMGVYEALTGNGSLLDKSGDVIANGAGFFSSAVGTTGAAGGVLSSLGVSGIGTSLSSFAASLGPAGAIAGAGAGGYALGELIGDGIDLFLNRAHTEDADDEAVDTFMAQHGIDFSPGESPTEMYGPPAPFTSWDDYSAAMGSQSPTETSDESPTEMYGPPAPFTSWDDYTAAMGAQ